MTSKRFKMFAKFCGLESMTRKGKRHRSNAKTQREKAVAKFYYGSHCAMRDYLMIALVHRSYQSVTTLKPFVPFSSSAFNCLISVEMAKKIVCHFLVKEDLSEEDLFQIEVEFNNMVKEDLYERLYHKGNKFEFFNFFTFLFFSLIFHPLGFLS